MNIMATRDYWISVQECCLSESVLIGIVEIQMYDCQLRSLSEIQELLKMSGPAA